MKGRFVFGCFLSVFSPLALLAQNGPDNDPDAAQGYVNSVFHHSSVESINLYNGQLTIPIPIGPVYSVGPKLKFQAMLTYTSRAWEFGHPSYELLNPPDPNLKPQQPFQPLFGDPALGIGWNFSLGAIKPCGLAQASHCHVGPDGAEHLFDWAIDSSHFKDRSGSQLYLHFISDFQGYEMWDGDGNHYVFGQQVTGFDDPAGNYFHDFGRGRNGWYLTSLTDLFGNGYSVSYYSRTAASPCPSFKSTCPNTSDNPDTSVRCPGTGVYSWVPQTIQLPGGAAISIGLDTLPATAQMIKTFTFPVFANGQSSSAVWTLNYQPDTFADIYCSVPLIELASLELPLPGAPKYLFQYAALSDGLGPGPTVLLTNMTVPTGASIQYEYGDYSFYHGRVAALGAGPTCQPKGPPTDATVIKSSLGGGSRPSTPLPNAPIDPCVPIGTSDYIDQRAGMLRKTETVPGAAAAVTNYTQYSFPFGEQGTSASGDDKSQSLTVVVGPPDVNGRVSAKSVLFWAGPRSGSFTYCGGGYGPLAPCPGDRTSAEIREAVYDHDPNTISSNVPMPSCGGANLLEFCPDKAARVVQRTYDYDFPADQFGNRRLLQEVTYQQATASNGTCSGCPFHQIDFSPSETAYAGHWEANGRHYDVESHTGTLGGTINRTITTTWTPSVSPWLPNLLNHRTEAEGSSLLDRRFEFTAGGFPSGESIYDAGRRLIYLTCRYPDAAGNVSKDFSARYPDQDPPSVTACLNAFPSYPTFGVGVNGDAFGKTYTYQNGLLLSSRWMANPTTPASWYLKSFSRDAATGWVTSSSDTAGLSTSYIYDSIGRVTSIAPPGGEAATTVNYPSTIQTIAQRNAGVGLSTYEVYDYDGLGRLVRNRRLMPSAQYSKRFTLYDGAGYAYFNSEWVADATPESVTADLGTSCAFSTGSFAASRPSSAPGTYRLCYDPFGRPQQAVGSKFSSLATVVRTDGSAWYSDTLETTTVACVNGTLQTSGACGSGGVNATTTTRKDAWGRTTSVTEPSNDVTSYAYDVNGKLTTVSEGSQSRSFSFDSAGFLRSETTPEKGTVNYTDYGSLGNVIKETEPDGVVRENCYDFAGRVTETRTSEGGTPLCSYETGGPQGRLYLSNVFNNSTGDNSLGKLTSRTAWNYPSAGTFSASDTYVYNGLGGRLSSQTTSISGGSNLSTTQSWFYNGLGLPAHHYHARPSGQTPFVVSYDYDAGLPVKEYANGIPVVTGVGYQASGALSGYATGINVGHNVTTTIGQDPSLLPRPLNISTSGATANFATGNYSYDGAGNIMVIGADAYGYDLRSRLTSASLSGAGSQAFTYDQYGNLLTKGGTTFCSGTCTNNQVTGGSFLRGNLTGYGGQSFAYDGLDRMTSSTQSSLTWNYLYDGSEERAAKIPPTGSWTYTIRDEGKRVATEFSATTPSRDNMFLGSQLVASYANGGVGGNGPVWVFYTSDHLGTPRLLTDVAGITIETRRYWPFGEAAMTPGSSQVLRFATMEFDAEGGTGPGLASDRYYDHARSHVGGFGRFLSPDRLGGKVPDPQTWNRYAYSRGNPLKYIDQNGEDFKSFLLGAANAIGTNFVPGTRGRSSDSDFSAGQTVGDVISIPLGAAEFIAGAALFTGGLTLDATGILIPAGVASNVAGATIATQGVVGSGSGILNLMERSGRKGSGSSTEREKTPTTDADSFEPVRGTKARVNSDTGEVWVKDPMHKNHYEVYRNKKDFENGTRTRAVWEDGRLKEIFR